MVDVEPAFSPDGSQIAFTSYRKGNRDIFVVKTDGSNLRQLTSNPLASLSMMTNNYSDNAPGWSPDGRFIVFASARNNVYWSFVDYDLFLMNPNGSKVSEWWASDFWSSDSLDYEPSWSPNGKWIAYCTDANTGERNIYVAPVEKSSSPPKNCPISAGAVLTTLPGGRWNKDRICREFIWLRIA